MSMTPRPNFATEGTARSIGLASKMPRWSHAERAAVVAVVLLAAIIIGAFWHTFPKYPSDSVASWGSFGDYFNGVLSPAIAGLTLWWLIYAVRLQRQELQDLRSSFAETVNISKTTARVDAYLQLRQRFTTISLALEKNEAIQKKNRWESLDPHGTARPTIMAYWYGCYDEWFLTKWLHRDSDMGYDLLWEEFYKDAIGRAARDKASPLYGGLLHMIEHGRSFGPRAEEFLNELKLLAGEPNPEDCGIAHAWKRRRSAETFAGTSSAVAGGSRPDPKTV